MPGLENVGIADLLGKLTNPGAYAAQIGDVRAELLRKIVEFSHRSSTLPLVAGVIALFAWARFAFPRRSLVRYGTGIAMLFIVFESLIGAVLVKKGLVTDNASQMRALMMPVHLVSTFVLLLGLSMTAWYGSGKARLQLRNQGPLGFAALFGLGLILWLSLSGSLSALGGMIYHFATHEALFQAATAADAPYLVAAKVKHPYTAAVVAMVLALDRRLAVAFAALGGHAALRLRIVVLADRADGVRHRQRFADGAALYADSASGIIRRSVDRYGVAVGGGFGGWRAARRDAAYSQSGVGWRAGDGERLCRVDQAARDFAIAVHHA